jgi:hypothetical protein
MHYIYISLTLIYKVYKLWYKITEIFGSENGCFVKKMTDGGILFDAAVNKIL